MDLTDTDRYELIDRIATGGMAEVYRAKAYGSHGFAKTLAIKRILPELANEPEFEQRFIREAKVSVKLAHANIVQVLDFGRFAGSLFIAMEYVDGLDLADVLGWTRRHNERVTPAVAIQIAVEVCKGLQFAHQQGVIHRDISPSNVLLSRAGEVKIADFGIAQMGDGSEAPGEWRKVMGKWRYMSPEQTRGERLTIQSDLFSVGVVLYELFTSEKLFPGADSDEIAGNIRGMKIPRLSEVRPELPGELDDILAQTLERDPTRRPQSAAVLLRQLTEIGYRHNLVATPADIETLVMKAIGEKRAPAKEGGGGGLDDLIRDQLAGLLGSSIATRRTEVGAQAVTGTAVVRKRRGSDGLTVFEIGAGTGRAETTMSKAQRGMTRRWRWAVAGIVILAATAAVTVMLPQSLPQTASPVGVLLPAVSTSVLTVDSVPSGALVMVDGERIAGETPLSVQVTGNTPHALRVELGGFVAWEKPRVVVPSGGRVNIRPRLARAPTTLLVTSAPEGAEVSVDGKTVGTTPFTTHDLERGKRRLVLTKVGYVQAEAVVTLENGDEVKVARTLTRKREFGSLDLFIEDGWADVYIGARRIGRAPAQGLRVPLGRHRLRLHNPASGRERMIEVDVGRGKNYLRTKL